MIRYRTTLGVICQFVMCFLIILPSCRENAADPNDISSYYLPWQSFPPEGMTYRYKSLVDTTLEEEVWDHISTPEGLITSINYDYQQQVVQKQHERVLADRVVIDSLYLYYPSDSIMEEAKAKVHTGNRFPFNVTDTSQTWLTHLEWWQPGDSLHIVLERRRQFISDTTWTFDGKTIPALRFKTHDKFETESVGWTESEWYGEEVYAKGIGLIYYRRNISKEMKIEFALSSRNPKGK